MTVMWQDGKVLWDSGGVAMDPACCCGSVPLTCAEACGGAVSELRYHCYGSGNPDTAGSCVDGIDYCPPFFNGEPFTLPLPLYLSTECSNCWANNGGICSNTICAVYDPVANTTTVTFRTYDGFCNPTNHIATFSGNLCAHPACEIHWQGVCYDAYGGDDWIVIE